MFARTDRGTIATWWWTVDKPLLGMIIALMFSGLVLSLAGKPACGRAARARQLSLSCCVTGSFS
jgi:hypothetical protein